MRDWIAYITIIFISVACSREPGKVETVEQQVAFIQRPEHGLHKKQECEVNTVELSYKPTQQLVMQEMGTTVDPVLCDSLKRNYDKYMYFIMTVTPAAGHKLYEPLESMQQYYDLVQTLAFRMNEYVSAKVGDKRVYSKATYFDQLYGITNSLSCMIVFDRAELQEETSFSISIKEFGLRTGICAFEFSNDDINNCPIIEKK